MMDCACYIAAGLHYQFVYLASLSVEVCLDSAGSK